MAFFCQNGVDRTFVPAKFDLMDDRRHNDLGRVGEIE
jgi:hypothetical protein